MNIIHSQSFHNHIYSGIFVSVLQLYQKLNQSKNEAYLLIETWNISWTMNEADKIRLLCYIRKAFTR